MLFQFRHSRAPPGVSGSPSLTFSLRFPLKPLSHVPVWSPQCVAISNPTPGVVQSSSFQILLGQIRRMLLRLLLMHLSNFCFSPLVSFQVSEPYNSTAFTFDSKVLNFVLVFSALNRHIGFSIANACLAFPMRAWISSSVPPLWLTILPRYVISSTSSMRPPPPPPL